MLSQHELHQINSYTYTGDLRFRIEVTTSTYRRIMMPVVIGASSSPSLSDTTRLGHEILRLRHLVSLPLAMRTMYGMTPVGSRLGLDFPTWTSSQVIILKLLS